MDNKSKLDIRKDKLFRIINNNRLWKLECATIIFFFMLDETSEEYLGKYGFNTPLNVEMNRVLEKYNTELIEFILSMNDEYKIVDDIY